MPRTTIRRFVLGSSAAVALALSLGTAGIANAATISSPLTVSTGNTSVSTTATCERDDTNPADFGTRTIKATINLVAPVGGSIRVDKVDVASGALLSQTPISASDSKSLTVTDASNGIKKVKPVRLLTHVVSSTGVASLKNTTTIGGQCGWADASYVVPTKDLWHYDDGSDGGAVYSQLVNGSDFNRTVVSEVRSVNYITPSYEGQVAQWRTISKKAVTVAANSTLVVSSGPGLGWGSCGEVTSQTFSGAGVNAPSYPYSSAKVAEQWKLSDGHDNPSDVCYAMADTAEDNPND